MENKYTFQERFTPIMSPSDQLDIKLAYVLAKFGHRAQVRKELVDGKPCRYFEHCRRVAITLMDVMKIYDRDMIIAALLHDTLEDCEDITAELIEHSFGNKVVTMVKTLSKVPKNGYIVRLANCDNWKVLALKACDRFDNLNSLLVDGVTPEFQKKQVLETEEHYLPLFEKLIKICPSKYRENIERVVTEIRNRLVDIKYVLEKIPA